MIVRGDRRPARALMDTAFVAGEHVVAGTRAVQAGPVVAAAGGARQPVAVFAQTQAPAFVAVAVAVGAVAGPVATATVKISNIEKRLVLIILVLVFKHKINI